MTIAHHDAMNLDKLRHYVLTHREDINAFHAYIDRSKLSGRMITIDPGDPDWEEKLEEKLRQAKKDTSESD